MKVAVVSAVDTSMKILLFAQLKAAQKAGYEVYGICSKGSNWDFLCEQGIKMHAVRIKRKISPFSDIAALWEMYKYFKKERIDIVHTHTPKCSLLGQLAARFAGVSIIINTIHGFYFHDNMDPFVKWFYIVMEWIAGKCSTMILSQNSEDMKTAIKLKICKSDKIKLLGNGVDLSCFAPNASSSEQRQKLREKNGIPKDAVVVGIIGRLVQEKGFLELFEAMRAIMERNPAVWLQIIGAEEPEKPDRISGTTFGRYNIAERTVWLGEKDPCEIPGLLACCDIYTLPSWREGFPRSAIEASAMGLPVVATNIRGCRQVVDNGKTGLLVELHNIPALEEALCELIDNKDMRKQMGDAAFEKAQKEFNEQTICKIVLDTYRKCLCEKGLIGLNPDNQT